jgi:hypothetical protein
MSDIFSFRIIRGPQRQANAEGIALYPLRPPKSKWQSKSSTTLLDRLVDAGPAASRQAQIFIDGKSFIDRRRELPVPLRDIDIWLMKRGNRTGPASVSKFASKVGSSPVPVLIASRSWYETRRALADSLVAAMVARHREPEVFVYLHRQIIVAGLVETLARTPSF